MSRGRHRRPSTSSMSRRFSRFSVALTAGGAGVAAPLLTSGSASAAPLSVWDEVAECASSGDWSADTGNGHYGGLQFRQSSWEMAGGTAYAPRADRATKEQQIAAAEKLLDLQGPAAWPTCGPAAGLRPDTAPQAGTARQARAETARKSAATHTVVSGDTLHRIAAEHDVSGGWEAVYEANRKTVGPDPDLIFPGQELTLATPAPAAERSREQAPRPAPRSDRGTARPATAQSYPDNLDGWIREALAIMRANGIPGTYDGIHRNIVRESGGNPNAVNNWDINAQRGTPSIGLLQVIKPTFDAYHVPGTARSQWDPVANIVAACNYAADRYGSIDNVNGPY